MIGFVVFASLNLIFTNIKAAILLLIVAVVAFIICMCFKRARQDYVILTAMMSVVLAVCLFLGCVSAPKVAYELFDNKECTVRLRLIESETKSHSGYCNIAETITINEKDYRSKIKVYSKNSLKAQPYDIIEGKFKLHGVNMKKDTGKFNLSQKVFLTASLSKNNNVKIEKISKKPLHFYSIKFRETIKNGIENNLPQNESAVARALLIGDRAGLDDEIKTDFSNIGVTHLTAVSGLHLSVWCLFALWMLQKAGLKGKLSYIIACVLTILFMAVTGFSHSVIRAGLMMLVMLLGKIVSQRADSLNSLGLAVLLMCFINPFCVFNVGFKMSVLATLGIVLGNMVFKQPYQKDYKDTSKTRIAVNSVYNCLSGTVLSAIFACTFTFPTTVLSFKKIPLIVLLSNVILGFPAAVCMISSGFLAIVCKVRLLHFLIPIFKYLARISASCIIMISHDLGELPYSYVKADIKVFYVFLLAAVLILSISCVVKIFKENFNFKIPVGLCAILIAVFCIVSIWNEQSKVSVTICDVGNGSAAVVCCKRECALIGCGGDDFRGHDKIDREIKSTGCKKIKFLYLPRNSKSESAYITKILKTNKIEYLLTANENEEIKENFPKLKYGISSFYDINLWKNVDIKCYTSYDESYAVLKINGKYIVINFLPSSNCKNINANVLICREKVPINIDDSDYDLIVLSSNRENGIYFEQKHKNLVSTGGNGSIRIDIYKNGKIEVERVS